MADTKQTKTIGEHYVAAELARRGWAPAMTRDGIERTDILAVYTAAGARRVVEVQVKAARGKTFAGISWPLGPKMQDPVSAEHEFVVLVAVLDDLAVAPRFFVAPRLHVAAAAWIEHMEWLSSPTVQPGTRNAGVERARSLLSTFVGYEDRWDLLLQDQRLAPVLLPARFREFAVLDRVRLHDSGHRWAVDLPRWGS